MKDKTISRKLIDILSNRDNIDRICNIRLYKVGRFWLVVHIDELYYPPENDDDNGVIASSEPNNYVPF